VTLLLANVVQNAIIGPDNSLRGGLVGVAVLVTLNAAVVRFVGRHDWAVRAFEGGDTPAEGRPLPRVGAAPGGAA
jgi:hypothetical protein